jgi:hypothetical protein
MDQDLLDLLKAVRGEGLEEVRRAEFLARLRADEAFRRAFVNEILMLGMLKAVQATEPRWLVLEDELGWSADERAARTPLEEGVLRGIRSLPGPRLARPWRGTQRSWVAAALAAAIALAALLVYFWPRGQQVLPPTPNVPPYVAVLVRSDGALWGPSDEPPPTEGSPLPAGPLHLHAGRVTLTFFNGVMLSLQGPADLDMTSGDRIFCHRGKLRARVPAGAEGFVVMAPGAAVVDLGTEFGLNVADDGTALLMVFEGQAEVSVLNSEGHTLRSQLLGRKMAAEVDPGAQRIREVAGVSDQFVAAPELIPPALMLDPSYPNVVRAAGPWGYWRFESLADRLVPNEVPGRPSLRAVGPVKLAGAPGTNHTALFGTTSAEQFLDLDGSWSPNPAGYAVELWALSEGFNASTLVSLISRAAEPAQDHSLILELTGVSHFLIHDPCRVRFLERRPAGSAGGINVFSRQMYIPYRWHHFVAQKAHDILELYLDGEAAGAAQADPDEGMAACRLLVGRLKSGRQPHLNDIRPFVGRLDELAVYDRPLSREEIRRHHELGSGARAVPR